MKYLPLIWSALWRKPLEAVLVWLAATFAFTLFGLMLGLHATYAHLIESSRMDRLDVNARFPSASPHGVLLPVALRGAIGRVDGVAAVGTYYWLWGHYQNPRKVARVIAVDRHMRAAWSELPLTRAEWSQLFATPTGVFVSRAPAARLGLEKGDDFPLITAAGLRADGGSIWDFHVLGVVPDDPRIGAFILGNFSYVDESRPLEDQGYAMGFRVAIRDAAQADEVSIRIDRLFANSSTPTLTIPDKVNTRYAINSGASLARSTWPLAGAGVFMILLLTANGIAQSVRERMPEFAVLETLGYRDAGLMALVFAEALIPCLAGAMLGSALASALTRWPAQYLPRGLAGIPQPTVSAAVVGWALGTASLLALASAVVPMWRLRHLKVADALAGR
ncbi:MAG TPA: ABC transporter permease [Steroidobacteraceae bacterium]|nr:ABC transporter permease [Steroidobacteraceae bacterium]